MAAPAAKHASASAAISAADRGTFGFCAFVVPPLIAASMITALGIGSVYRFVRGCRAMTAIDLLVAGVVRARAAARAVPRGCGSTTRCTGTTSPTGRGSGRSRGTRDVKAVGRDRGDVLVGADDHDLRRGAATRARRRAPDDADDGPAAAHRASASCVAAEFIPRAAKAMRPADRGARGAHRRPASPSAASATSSPTSPA